MKKNLVAPEQKDILAFLGVTMLSVQTTEQLIRLVLTYVIQAQPLTLESLQSINQKKRNKTIGFLLCELRKRVDLNDTFDTILRQFLEMRNSFIHSLDEIPGWSLDDEHGLNTAENFLAEFLNVIEIVQSVFLGLVRSWQEQIGMSDRDIGISPHSWIAEIDAKFKPLVERTFFAKE
jgi:hypothetical protein